jgi:branched-chain amino acid transport system permease protein
VFTILAALGCLFFSYDFRQALIFSMLGALACLSLVVVTGFVGQVSLLQFGLAGVAGLVTSKLALHAGIGFPLGPIVGVVAATALGVAVATSALRIRGVQLAVVTLAGAVAVDAFVFGNAKWGAGLSGSAVPTPHLFGLNLGPTADFPIGGGKLPSPAFALICLGTLVVVGLFVASLRRGVLGKQMLAVRSNESAAACAGISPRRVKVGAFALSSFIAGLAGVLYGYNFGSIDSSHFGTLQALSLVAYAYIGGITTVTGSLIAGFLITEGLASHIGTELGIPINYQLLLAGLGLLVTVITSPGGVALVGPPQIVRLLDRAVAAFRPQRLPVAGGEVKR